MNTSRITAVDPEEDEGEALSAFASATMGFVAPQPVALPTPPGIGSVSMWSMNSPFVNDGNPNLSHPWQQQQSQVNWRQHCHSQRSYHGQDPPPQERPQGQLQHPYQEQQNNHHDPNYGLDQPSYLEWESQLHPSYPSDAYPQRQLPGQNNHIPHATRQNQFQQQQHVHLQQYPGSLRGLANLPDEEPINQYPESKRNSSSVASHCNRSRRTVESTNRSVTFHDNVVNHQGGNNYHDDDPSDFLHTMKDITENESIDGAPSNSSPPSLSSSQYSNCKEAPSSSSFVAGDSEVASANNNNKFTGMDFKQKYSSNYFLPPPQPKRGGKGVISGDCRSLPGTNSEKKKKTKNSKKNRRHDAVSDALAASDVSHDGVRDDDDVISEQKRPLTQSLKEKYRYYSSSRSLPPKTSRKNYYDQGETETDSDEEDGHQNGQDRSHFSSYKSNFHSQTDQFDPDQSAATSKATKFHDNGYSSFDDLLSPVEPSVNSRSTEIERSLEDTATEDEAEYYRNASSKMGAAAAGLFSRKGGGMNRFFSSGESTSLFSISSASSRSGMSLASKDIKIRGSRTVFFSKNHFPQHKLLIAAAAIIVALCVYGQFSQYWDRDALTSSFFQSSENKMRRAQENTRDGFLTEEVVSNQDGSHEDSQETSSPGNDDNNTVVITDEKAQEVEHSRNPDDKFIEHVGGTSHIPFFEQLMNPSYSSSYSELNGSEHLTKFTAEERVVEKLHSPDLYGLKDNWDPIEIDNEIPILWHIPKTGGTTVQDIAGACHGKVIACEIGVKYGHSMDTELKILQLQRQSYVNVDTTTLDGLIRAKRLRLVRTKSMVDLIVSPYFHEVDQLFGPPFVDGQIRGRVVTMFRHPIERAISSFNYLQIAHWEQEYRPEMQGWTVEQYATSDVIEDNWMTRQLVHVDSSTPLNMGHLQLAMDVIRRKVFVGLMSRFEESLERFEAIFQWKYTFNPTEQEACRESMLAIGSNVSPRGRGNPVPPPGTPAYNFILSHNKFDMQLYKYAESLFDEQARLVTGIEGGFRFHEASCSKCEVSTLADAGLLE